MARPETCESLRNPQRLLRLVPLSWFTHRAWLHLLLLRERSKARPDMLDRLVVLAERGMNPMRRPLRPDPQVRAERLAGHPRQVPQPLTRRRRQPHRTRRPRDTRTSANVSSVKDHAGIAHHGASVARHICRRRIRDQFGAFPAQRLQRSEHRHCGT